MLQRRLFAALVVLAAATIPLAGQEKDKDAKAKDAKANDAKDAAKDTAKKDAKPADKDAKPAEKDAKAADKDKDKAAAAPAGKVSLKWKLEKGKTFYQKMTTKTDQNMKILNSEPKQTQNQTFY